MTAALEDVKTLDLEEWLTLNTAAAPTKIKQGQSPDMQNVWVDEKPGSIITAPGLILAGTTPSGNPSSFCINFFRTAAGTQTFVVSDNQKVWTTVDFQAFTEIISGLSASFQLRGKVIRDKLWLTNGSDSVRTYDGTTVTVLDGTGGTPNVPKGRYIDYHDERVWVYHIPSERSQAAFSALVDASGTIIDPDNASAWPSSNTLQVSEGDADFGTGMLLYRGYLHFFKQYSIWRLVGYDEYTYTRVKTRSSTGTRFNESIQQLDGLVHFIGVDGVYVFDGEDSERISDIIDPASASQTAFGFNQLQQPNVNTKFWEVSDTADWNAGTVPANTTVDDSLTLKAADDSQANFEAGSLSDVTASSGEAGAGTVILSRSGVGVGGPTLISGAASVLTPGAGFSVIGSASMITDTSQGSACGFTGSPANGNICSFDVTIPYTIAFSQIILHGWQGVGGYAKVVYIYLDGVKQTVTAVDNGGTLYNNGAILPSSSTVEEYTINITPQTASATLSLKVEGAGTLSEIDAYGTAYKATGSITSRAFDFGEAPESTMGTLYVSGFVQAGTSLTYYTQTSADGISWDAAIALSNGADITSTPRRYLRYRIDFTSTGDQTPSVSSVWIGAQYISAVHDTSGNISAWSAIESDPFRAGQTIYYYYRGATSAVGVASASWNLIAPGSVLGFSTSFRYVQFKFLIAGGTPTNIPIVPSVTIHWVAGGSTQQTILQNVASAYWRNRYWLSAAGPGATANDTVLIRGKKTFGSPWMLKNWQILSFTRFEDNLYGCSSVDGSIYRLDTGYSIDEAAMDSYFQTGDFIVGGFKIEVLEMLVEVERKGPYDLSVGISFDRGNTFTEYSINLTASDFDSSFIKKINVNLSGDRFRVRFRTNGVDEPFEVHRCIIFYRLSPVRGSLHGEAA